MQGRTARRFVLIIAEQHTFCTRIRQRASYRGGAWHPLPHLDRPGADRQPASTGIATASRRRRPWRWAWSEGRGWSASGAAARGANRRRRAPAASASTSGPAPIGNRPGASARNGTATPTVPSQNFARSQEPPPDRGTLERFTGGGGLGAKGAVGRHRHRARARRRGPGGARREAAAGRAVQAAAIGGNMHRRHPRPHPDRRGAERQPARHRRPQRHRAAGSSGPRADANTSPLEQQHV